ncbi:MAG TPA: hypothetical protein VKP30_28700 [Polyangiaceae bacterium]|nr:hypothetical protein [Polyangiaceae bacterium]
MELVKSADVLDPTHEASRPYRASIVGHFERIGPNAWDDYRFIKSQPTTEMPPSSVDVLPGVPLQLEARGAEVRMRSNGRVIRVRWLPDAADLERLGRAPEPRAIREFFIRNYLAAHGSESGLGVSAVVVRKLNQ